MVQNQILSANEKPTDARAPKTYCQLNFLNVNPVFKGVNGHPKPSNIAIHLGTLASRAAIVPYIQGLQKKKTSR